MTSRVEAAETPDLPICDVGISCVAYYSMHKSRGLEVPEIGRSKMDCHSNNLKQNKIKIGLVRSL